jgi:hypothetical protein
MSYDHFFVTARLSQFLCLLDDAILQASCQCMMSRTDTMSTGNSRAAYMREYRIMMRLEEENCNNIPKGTKLHAEQLREYRETHTNLSAEYIRNYKKHKAQEKVQENKTPQPSLSTDCTPTPIIYNYDQASEYFQKNFIGNSFGYACDICDNYGI